MSGLADLVAGRVTSSAEHFDVGASIFLDGNQREVARWCRAGAATADALRGATASAEARLEEVDELHVEGLGLNEALVDEARGWLAAAQGDRLAAGVLFGSGARSALALGDRFHGARLLHAQARVGDVGVVADELEALAAAHPGGIAPSLAAHLAVLRPGAGPVDADDPAAHLVVDLLEQRGLLLFAGEAAAEASRRAQRGGDGRAAARWAARSTELHDRCQGARTHVGILVDGPTPLTDRERDVARLAAERLPSKEIAARLGLSRRTVDNYLRQVYRKLGVSSRHDLPAALRDHR
ncbi:MAG: helix-turn-helix transcriptional regulator [Actinobacteria bacterium]|nr:helix-turn-helix transcriptional regulator [Actinomycetota bacterium]